MKINHISQVYGVDLQKAAGKTKADSKTEKPKKGDSVSVSSEGRILESSTSSVEAVRDGHRAAKSIAHYLDHGVLLTQPYLELPSLDDLPDETAEKIALAAIKFFMVKIDPIKEFTFNPEESLSFEGETGPYLQYAHARCCSVLKKYGKKVPDNADFSNYKGSE